MEKDEAIKSRSLTWRITFAIVLLMGFQTFQYVPGTQYAQELFYGLCILVLLIGYPIWKCFTELLVTSFEIYLLVLIFLAILLPAWGAQREFGQPLIFGMLAQRHFVLLAVPLFIFLLLRARRLHLREIGQTLILLAWGTLVLDTLVLIFLNPENFVSQTGFVTENAQNQAEFILPLAFIIFGLVYYALLGLRTKRTSYYIRAVIFLIFVLLNIDGRAFLASLAVTFLYFVYRRRTFREFMGTAVKTVGLAVATLGLLFALSRDYASTRLSGLGDAFNVVLTGSQVQDASANARLAEAATALPYIQRHPLIGNGTLSNQWNGGPKVIIGEYFYADDIGIIGVIYTVGLIGLFIFAYQFWFGFRAARKLRNNTQDPLLDATAACLLLSAINSLTTGGFMFDPEITLFFVAILAGIAYRRSGDYPAGTQQVPFTHAVIRVQSYRDLEATSESSH